MSNNLELAFSDAVFATGTNKALGKYNRNDIPANTKKHETTMIFFIFKFPGDRFRLYVLESYGFVRRIYFSSRSMTT